MPSGGGAGPLLLGRGTSGGGFLSSYMKWAGPFAELLYGRGGGAANPPDAAFLPDNW